MASSHHPSCTEYHGDTWPRRRQTAGSFSWRLFARADESATETNLPARPLFARVGGRVLILGPAIRRGAFFFRKAAGPAPRPDYNLASLLAHDHPISRTSNPVICITVPGSGRAYKQWAPAKFPPSAEALWPAACVRAPAPVTFFTIT